MLLMDERLFVDISHDAIGKTAKQIGQLAIHPRKPFIRANRPKGLP